MSISTWADGTPKSQNNAFNLAPRTHKPMTRSQIRYMKEAEKRTATAEQLTSKVLKKNKDTYINETQASRDRTASITGKSISLGRTL